MKTDLFLLPYFMMIIVGLMLPSDGNHGLFTPKSLSFLSSTFMVMMYFIAKRKASMYQLKVLSFMFVMVSFLLIWMFLGVMNDLANWAGIFDQFKIFVITLSFVIVTLYLISEKIITPQRIMRTIIFANFSYSCAKMLLMVLHFLKIVNMWSILERIGFRFMNMEITGVLARFQTSVDIVTPFVLFFVLQSDVLGLGLSKRFKRIYYVISVVAIMFSFSRFLMGVGFMSAMLYWITLDSKKFVRASIAFFIFVCGFVAVIGPGTIITMIERRFFSTDNYLSDLTRVQQIEALMEQYYTAPYLGQGLGGYVKNFVRDGALVHSYEVQWVAFLMQFGLIGITLLMIPLGIISSQFILRTSFSRVHWACFGLFLIWLLSGFTNPFLISLASGIIYSLFLLAGMILNDPTPSDIRTPQHVAA